MTNSMTNGGAARYASYREERTHSIILSASTFGFVLMLSLIGWLGCSAVEPSISFNACSPCACRAQPFRLDLL